LKNCLDNHIFIRPKNKITMVSFYSILATAATFCVASSTALAPRHEDGPKCLSDSEAYSIAKNWLAIWGTGYLTKKSQLTKLVTKDVLSFDGTFGAATVGIDALFDAATFVDPLVTKVLQTPELVFHNCDHIAARWSYTAVSTGNGSLVYPALDAAVK
jgi:hypothetical protein